MTRRIEFDDDFESFMFDMRGDPDVANSVIDSIYQSQTEHFGNGYVEESDASDPVLPD